MASTFTITLVTLVILFLALRGWEWFIFSAALDQKVDLTGPTELAKTLRVHASDRYFLSLVFDRRGHSVDRIFTAVGYPAQLGAPGAAIPVRWSLTEDHSNVLVASGERETLGSNASSGREVERLLGQFDLASGVYRFHLDISRACPEFSGISTRIVLTLLPKFTHSRSAGLAMLGAYVSRLVILPSAAVVAGILAFRAL